MKIRAAALIALLPVPALAGPLEFTFVNPSFGGNPMNGALMMSRADRFRPSDPVLQNTKTQADYFVEQLQRRALSSLATALLSDLSDASGAAEGSYVFEDFTLDYVRQNDTIRLLIDDGMQILTIELPSYAFDTD
ncbi:MAG: curli assembly protein CsgF [Flavimaricola sp.]|nr:curli assembly protein CsgF [Flavimaricola sp.]